ncbi:group 1 truncated hemoglobin [Colwellia sp. MB02u-10]|jgi:hemoglobin|uniref:group I truncated hemoglobin n=1 Tax=Colwellia sp. MB02u-10 TaxID=2759828 RepID=UPI0015F5FEFC|nr:group 1 truncated hemoglobin [Colwellia sp. MB02u-10]MBA6341022.1 group 1 truncated hemoglobin [Colwellia sp. MB02u-10]
MTSINYFEKYGGFATLYPLVGEFYDAVLASDIVAYIFEPIRMEALIEHQTKYLAAMMGGPGEYDDEKLKSAHSQFKITEIEWNEVVNIFIATLNNFKVEDDDINTLASLIAARKSLIVAE